MDVFEETFGIGGQVDAAAVDGVTARSKETDSHIEWSFWLIFSKVFELLADQATLGESLVILRFDTLYNQLE